MTELIFRPDLGKELVQVSERFELPYDILDSPLFPERLEKEAKRIARLAAEKQALRGWHWRTDLPVVVDKSELQVDLSSLDSTELIPAKDSGSNFLENKVAYVVKMWFVVPQQVVEDITFDYEWEAREEGMVKDMPEFVDNEELGITPDD